MAFFGVNMIFGSSRPEGLPREIVVLVGLGSFGFLLLGFYALFLRHCVTGTVFVLGEEAYRATKFLALWIVVSLFGLAFGLLYGNENNYLVGDFFKFTQAAMAFYLAYFSFRQREGADWFLVALALLLAASAAYSLLSHWAELEASLRVATRATVFAPFVLPIQLYLLNRRTSPSGTLLHATLLGVTAVSLLVSQSRGLILLALAGLGTLWLLHRKPVGAGSRNLILPAAALVLVGLAAWYFLPGGLVTSTQATVERFRAATEAVQATHRDPSLIGVLGSRVPELVAVLEEFQEFPLRIFFGFGMGSQLETVRGVDLEWGTTHFMHLGWAEILFRTGLPGLVSFLLLCFYFLRRFYQARADQPLVVLAFALGVQHGLSVLISFPFVTDTLVFAVYGMTLADLERKKAERQ